MRETSSWLEARKAWVFVGLFAALGACSDTPETASGAETSDPTDTANKPAGPTSNDAGRVVDGGGSSPSATGRDAGPGKGSVPTAGPDAATSGSGEIGTTSSDGGTRSDAGANASDAAVMAGPEETGTDDCTEVPSASDAAPPRAGAGAGQVFFYAPNKNPFVRLRTKMLVPKPPNKRGILFLWPGLQPLMGGNNYNPIGLGVLQPVLTWGPSCAPNHLGDSYDSWWISSQYVNTYGNAKGFTGCHGGASMKVGIGDVLAIDMKLSGKSPERVLPRSQVTNRDDCPRGSKRRLAAACRTANLPDSTLRLPRQRLGSRSVTLPWSARVPFVRPIRLCRGPHRACA